MEKSKRPNIEFFVKYLLESQINKKQKRRLPPVQPPDPTSTEEYEYALAWAAQYVKKVDRDLFIMYLHIKFLNETLDYKPVLSQYENRELAQKETWKPNKKILYLFRGINKGTYIKEVIKANMNWLYTDSGYLEYLPPLKEIHPGGKKFRRIVYNGMHDLGTMSATEVFKRTQAVIDESALKKRFRKHTGQSFDDFKLNHGEKINRGDKILLVVPSEKVILWYKGITLGKSWDKTQLTNPKGTYIKQWKEDFIKELRAHTDKEIVIREKPPILDRRVNPLYNELKTGKYHCVVTYNSIASIESVVMGIPCICLGENAGSYLSETKIENVENPYFPEINKIRDHLLYLCCMQFKTPEILSGFWYKLFTAIKGEIKPRG